VYNNVSLNHNDIYGRLALHYAPSQLCLPFYYILMFFKPEGNIIVILIAR